MSSPPPLHPPHPRRVCVATSIWPRLSRRRSLLQDVTFVTHMFASRRFLLPGAVAAIAAAAEGKHLLSTSPRWVASFCLWARRDPATPAPSTSCLPRRPSNVTLDSLDGSVAPAAPAALAHTPSPDERERDGRKDQHFATVAEVPSRPAEASAGGRGKAREKHFGGSFTATGSRGDDGGMR